MTKDDKIFLLRFITRTGMYITVQDKDNIVSFIHGYEMGSPTLNFTDSIKKNIVDNYSVQSGSTGWPGQIHQLSEKLSLNWVTTFKKIILELITSISTTDLQDELDQILKTRIEVLITRINKTGNPWFNKNWIEEWLSLCSLNSDWFKKMWTISEYNGIKLIDQAVHSNKVFVDKENKLPTVELIQAKEQFDFLT